MTRPVRRRRACRAAGVAVMALLVASSCGVSGDTDHADKGAAGEGRRARLALAPRGGGSVDRDALEDAAQIIEGRLAAAGVSDAKVTVGGRRVVVDLRNDEDVEVVTAFVTTRAVLTFRPVLEQLEATDQRASAALGQLDGEAADHLGDDPTKEAILVGRFNQTGDGRDQGRPIYRVGPALVSGDTVETATASDDVGRWVVLPVLKPGPEGIDRFNEATTKCWSRSEECPLGSLAVVLDGEVLMVPEIQAPSYERDQIQLSGAFGKREAQRIAISLRFGALPLQFEVQRER